MRSLLEIKQIYLILKSATWRVSKDAVMSRQLRDLVFVPRSAAKVVDNFRAR